MSTNRGTRKKASDPIELINTGTTPITYSSAGHVLGGGDRVRCDEPDRVALAAIDHGYLRAQQGETWLVVRDGQLVPEETRTDTPETDSAPTDGNTAGEPAPSSVGASDTGDQHAEG